ncbi:MAG TPA: acetolactate decarboxylase [Thermodesulfobacteriota bacterium]
MPVRFVGSQRETAEEGRVEARIDLASLAGRPHLCAVGPLAALRGEVTVLDGRASIARVVDGRIAVDDRLEGGAAFLVWAEVPAWRTVPIPAHVRTKRDLEAFLPEAAHAAGLDPAAAFPFVVTGRAAEVRLHVLDRKGDGPHDLRRHEACKARFTFEQVDLELVGFHSVSHQGVFTPPGGTTHMHARTPDNRVSGHLDGVRLVAGARLGLPSLER